MNPTLEFPSDTPGLVKREIVDVSGNGCTIRETWDTTVPGCPIAILEARAILELPENVVKPTEYYKPSRSTA